VRIGIGIKLFFAWLCTIAIAALTADLLLERETERFVTDQVRSDLVVRANAAAKEATNHTFAATEVARWDAVADDEGKVLDARVTLIRKDGVVVGDSEVATDALATRENHATRPEVADALNGNVGSNARRSATIGVALLYVAVPVETGAIAVARVAKPLSAVNAAVTQLREIIGTASGLALAIAAALSVLVARRVSGTLRDLTDAARKMAAGDLSARSQVRGNDELGELGEALDAVATKFEQSKKEHS